MESVITSKKIIGNTILNQDLTGYKILVVDDDAEMRELLVILLKMYGAQAFSVSSVKKAFEFINVESSLTLPDLIISDISMPVEDGFDLITKLRRLHPDEGGKIPAIALTALTNNEARQKALSLGFQFFLTKPFEHEEVISIIKQILPRAF